MSNKGSSGVDEMPVEQLMPYLQEHWAQIKADLLEGAYQPQAVRCVEIPKPNGGVRQLGIPTVLDRFIQQALHQVLSPLFEPNFSKSSYGFRPRRSAQQAVTAARKYVAEGRRWVVDLDLEKFFDRVNHDILMSRLARRISDKRVLGLIRRYLQAGLMKGGVMSQRVEGTPQGGPITPPTMLQNAPCGARFKRELIYPEHDIHLAFLDLHAFDQCLNNITLAVPVSLIQPILDFQGEVFQSTDNQMKFGLQSRMIGELSRLFL
jgi:hypothetical protein